MKYLLLILIFISTPVFATKYNLTGTVHTLRDSTESEDTDFLLINGATSAGSCGTSSGMVVIRIPDSANRSFSVALAAQSAGKSVVVGVDDTNIGVGGHCVMRWINIQPNA